MNRSGNRWYADPWYAREFKGVEILEIEVQAQEGSVPDFDDDD